MKWLRKLFGQRQAPPEDPEAAMERRRKRLREHAQELKKSGKFDLKRKPPPTG